MSPQVLQNLGMQANLMDYAKHIQLELDEFQ